MALNDIIRNGVALANNLTGALQDTVYQNPWVGNDGFGGEVGAPIARKAIVERKQKLVRTSNGEQVLSSHILTFVSPIDAVGGAGRKEPIDPRDTFTLADGTTGKILDTTGVVDPAIHSNYFHQVFLG